MNVAQVSGQFGQMHLHIHFGLIPVEQRADGEVVPQVMDARAATAAWLAQADLTGHQQEPAMNGAMEQSASAFPNEKSQTARLRINLVPKPSILLQRLHGGWVQRHQS